LLEGNHLLVVAAYYKLLLQSGKENTGEMSRFRGSIGYELDMHGQWGGELAVCLSHVVLCEGMDAAEILLQASAACFALLALSGIQACFRERERGGQWPCVVCQSCTTAMDNGEKRAGATGAERVHGCPHPEFYFYLKLKIFRIMSVLFSSFLLFPFLFSEKGIG
jgi:hypothetical protein